mgnify:CR=1 FL=1
MFAKFRSLIFKIDPEVAHNLAIKSLKLNFVKNIFIFCFNRFTWINF